MATKASRIVWNISVNKAGASAQINLLKQEVRELNQEWRNQYRALMSAGQYQDALKVKQEGLARVSNKLSSNIHKVNEMLDNSEGEAGTRKYKKAEVALKGFSNQTDRTATSLQNVRRQMVLYNQSLRDAQETERSNKQTGEELVQQYQSEGNEMAADRQKSDNFKHHLIDLRYEYQKLGQTIKEARKPENGLDNPSDPRFNRLIHQQRAVANEMRRLKHEQRDFDSGLTTGTKYNSLYNQSTNKLIASLKSMKQSTQANRVEYNRLIANQGNELKMLNLEKEKVRDVARVSGETSIAYQKENSRLTSLDTSYTKHMNRINVLGNTYSRMSGRVATAIDNRKLKMRSLDLASHRELETAHSLTNASIALGAAFVYGSHKSMVLENQFNRVRNLLNTSGESFKQATNEIHQMGRATEKYSIQYGVSQENISKGYEALVRRGYTGKQALASQKYYLQGTIASGDKYNDVMHTAASTLEAFNMRSNNTNKMVANTKKVVNQLAYSSDLTATDMKGIGYGMQYVGDTAHNAHQSLSETSSALGELSNRGENSTVAATGLRKILLSLSTIKTSRNNKALTKLGLQPKDLLDAKGNLKSLQDIFSLFQDKMRGMSRTEQATVFKSLFGTTGINSAFALKNSTKQLKSLNSQVAKSQDQAKGQGYAAKIARNNMNSTQMQMKRMQMAGEDLAKSYAEGINPAFKRLAGASLLVAKGFGSLPKPIKDAVAIGTTAIPIIAGLNYGLSAINKTRSIFNSMSLRMIGIGRNEQLQLKSQITGTDQANSAEEQRNLTISKATELINAKQQAEQRENETKADGTKIEDENTQATGANSRAQGANAESETVASGRHPIQSASNFFGGSLGTGFGGRALKNYGKAGLGMGALVGGTEMLNGDVKGGAADAIGTTAGTALGGVAAGPLGAAIGGVAGPMLARTVGRGASEISKEVRQSQYKALKKVPTGSSYDRINTRNLNNNLRGISRSSQNFVKEESQLESKATNQIALDGGKVGKNVVNTYNKILSLSESYGAKELKSKEANINKLHKEGLLNNSQYSKAVTNARSSEQSNLKNIEAIHQRLITSDRKNASQREKDLSALNGYMLRLTNGGYKRLEKLKSNLYKKDSNLTERQYEHDIKLRKKDLHNSISTANKKYKSQVKSVKEQLNTLKHGNKDQRALYREAYKNAHRKRTGILAEYKKEKNQSINSAKKESNGVKKATNARVSDSVKKAYEHKQAVIRNNAKIRAENRRHHREELKEQKQAQLGSKESQEKYVHDMKVAAHQVVGFGAGIVHFFEHLPHLHLSGLRHPGGDSHANGTFDTQALHFAQGSLPGISKAENAVINDGGGRELVKMPNGQFVLPGGRNVHTFLPKGTSIFNAEQTRRILGMINQPSIHHADGTVPDSDGQSSNSKGSALTVKTPQGGLKGTEKSTRKSMKHIHDLLDKGYKKTNKDVQQHLDDLHDNSDNIWSDTADLTKKHSKNIHDDTTKRFNSLKNNINNIQNRSNRYSNGNLNWMVSAFRRHFNMIPPISRSSMQRGVANINGGISAIDKVLAQFGGNSHVLGAVRYATGTSGPSVDRQLAVLNDANSGPRQEAVVSDQGRVRFPRGRNVLTSLNPGDMVMNGSDTLKAIKSGMIPHYAGGKQSMAALRKIADRYSKAPTAFTNNTFNRLATVVGTALAKGTTNSSKAGAQKPANAWSNAMWKYIDNLIAGSSSKFLSYAEHKFSGIPYKYGAESMSKADCSGMIDMAARHFGINLPHQTDAIAASPQVQYMGKSNPKPGYLAIFGHGGTTGHIGITLGNGSPMMFDETPPKAGVTPIDCGDALDGYYKLKGLPNDDDNEVKRNPLTSRVKRQLGTPASDWIYKNLGDGGMGNPSGTGVKHWRSRVIKALQENGFPASSSQVDSWLQVINRETGGTGNPNLVNHWDSNAAAGHPSEGLVQTIGPTFEANKFPGHNNVFNGYDDLLAGIHYAASRYGRGSGMFSRVASTGYANGGLSMTDKTAHISEGNLPEMVLPLTDKNRAVELMFKSLQYMFGNSQNQSSHQSNTQTSHQDQQFERELIQSNKQKDFEINKLAQTTNKILTKMTVLIQAVKNKPVVSTAQIYSANRNETMKRARLRNFARGTF